MTQRCLQDWMELVPITKGHLMNSESLLICRDHDCNLLLHMILPAFQSKLSKYVSPIQTYFQKMSAESIKPFHGASSQLLKNQVFFHYPCIFECAVSVASVLLDNFPNQSCSLPRASVWQTVIRHLLLLHGHTTGLVQKFAFLKQKQWGDRPLLSKLSDFKGFSSVVLQLQAPQRRSQRHPVQFLTAAFCVW